MYACQRTHNRRGHGDDHAQLVQGGNIRLKREGNGSAIGLAVQVVAAQGKPGTTIGVPRDLVLDGARCVGVSEGDADNTNCPPAKEEIRDSLSRGRYPDSAQRRRTWMSMKTMPNIAQHSCLAAKPAFWATSSLARSLSGD